MWSQSFMNRIRLQSRKMAVEGLFLRKMSMLNSKLDTNTMLRILMILSYVFRCSAGGPDHVVWGTARRVARRRLLRKPTRGRPVKMQTISWRSWHWEPLPRRWRVEGAARERENGAAVEQEEAR